MVDFGRVLDEWESMGGARTQDAGPTDGAVRRSLEQWLDANPPPDKDATPGGEAPRTTSHPARLPVDDSIDLHGFRLDEAIAATAAFIDRSVAAGCRKVVVIHGKGEDGQGILRREVRAYLERHPATGAMGYSKGPAGGRGALWVVLRGDPAGREAGNRVTVRDR